jgi:hypothetical protein
VFVAGGSEFGIWHLAFDIVANRAGDSLTSTVPQQSGGGDGFGLAARGARVVVNRHAR